MRTAVYPGSFDPVTNGHIDVIKRSLKLFDKIIVAVLENSRKEPLFSVKERIEMIKAATKGMNAEVESFSGLLVDYLKKKKTNFVIRGLRAMSDFDYEFQMAIANKSMNSEIETIFIMTDKKYFYLNSRLVKEMARLGGPLGEFVPRHVENELREKFSK